MKRKYCWISTTASEDGLTLVVRHRHASEAEAKYFSETDATGRGGYEGPVPIDMYPVGKVVELDVE